jgi:hypothetical protein
MEERLKTGRYRNDYPLFNDGTNYCFSCGADIRKPEPSVIIRKSGETWVKKENGIDYLLLNPDFYKGIDLSDVTIKIQSGIWKQISKIEINDEIAKLNPIVKKDTLPLQFHGKLIHIEGVYSFTIRKCLIVDRHLTNDISLATVSDLEEQS